MVSGDGSICEMGALLFITQMRRLSHEDGKHLPEHLWGGFGVTRVTRAQVEEWVVGDGVPTSETWRQGQEMRRETEEGGTRSVLTGCPLFTEEMRPGCGANGSGVEEPADLENTCCGHQ